MSANTAFHIAVLAGDALIVQAFGVFADAGAAHACDRLPALLGIVARAAGAPYGIAAGQAWESEPAPDLGAYHRAKTAALFTAAAQAGACAAGHAHAPWRELGECLGEAYQVGDDLRDAVSSELVIGKPVGKDKALYVSALKNTLAMYSETGRMDPKGAEAVLAVFSQSSPDVAKANIDLSKTYTNTYVDAANKKMGMK